VAAKQVQRQ